MLTCVTRSRPLISLAGRTAGSGAQGSVLQILNIPSMDQALKYLNTKYHNVAVGPEKSPIRY